MKQIGRLINSIAIFGVACAAISFTGNLQAQNTQQGKAVVRAVKGSAKYSTGGAEWMALTPGTTLYAGSTVSTAADSVVDLYLGMNGPVVRVTEDTTLGLDKLTFTDTGADPVVETQLDLKKGTIMGNVRKLAAASRYEIKTPKGVAGIRGTDYVISDNMVLFIIKGLGHVAYVLEDDTILSETVSTGEAFVPPGGKRPITASELETYGQQIAEALATILGDEDFDIENLSTPRVLVDPQTGEQDVSPTETEGSLTID